MNMERIRPERSYAAGLLIGIGCVNLCVVGGLIGNLTFGFALVCILTFGLKLFTGCVGESSFKPNEIVYLTVVLMMNGFGVMTVASLFNLACPEYAETVNAIIAKKQSLSVLQVLIKAGGCGFLMQCAVTAYRKHIPLLCWACVFVFLQLGFEHCIADTFFLNPDWKSIGYFWLYVAGNTIGAKIAYWFGIKEENKVIAV